ncbi:MAG: flavodoxin family protein [Thermodesulfobacteriota bacterium]|nr:flavodoxin family protein [Thermodesulfobacteriota bacterium]
MDILGISASPRKNSNSDKIMTQVLKSAKENGAKVLGIKLRDYTFSSCIGCEKCRKQKTCTQFNDGMTLIYPLIEKAHALVWVTPVHTYNVSAPLKSLIDRMYCYYDFTNTRPRGWSSRLAGRGRKAVIACIGEQETPDNLGVAIPAMRLPLESHGYEIVGELTVLEVFDPGKVAQKTKVMDQAAKYGRILAAAVGTDGPG